MRKAFYLVSALLLLAACGGKDNGKDPNVAVRAAAEQYYGYLVKGDVDSYMAAINGIDSMPQEYRSQLRDMFLQYLDNEKQQRGGLVAAHVTRDTIVDSLWASAYVELSFGDSTKEQVSLPLVLTDKGWKLK